MKRLSLLLSLVAVFCSMSLECKDSTRVEYYRQARINGKCQIVGAYPISPRESKEVNCYRFTCDREGNPPYDVQEWLTKVEYLKRCKSAPDPKFGITQIKIEYPIPYEPHQRWSFFYEKGNTWNWDSVYYVEVRYDSLSYPSLKKNLDLNWDSMEDKHGVAEYLYSYDTERDQLLMFRINTYLDTLIDEDGVYMIGWRLDEDGNVIEKAFYDKDGNLTRNFEGYALVLYRYDEFGNSIEEKYYDERGLLSEENEEGFAVIQSQYDSLGYRIESRCYGIDGRLKESSAEGAAVFRLYYNDFGDLVGRGYYGTAGSPIEINDYKIASYRIDYDSKGRKTGLSYFGVDGKPKMSEKHEFARMVSKYNWEGNPLEERYLNEEGGLTNNIDGVAVVKWGYGFFGRLNSIKSYDKDGALVQVYYERPRRTLKDFLGIR
ncbi:hypothetical protein JXM67_01435 [candidate division WOR-3 bacterium]|nr:hypothetical protein [candidate division WOR-3 bacterium]